MVAVAVAVALAEAGRRPAVRTRRAPAIVAVATVEAGVPDVAEEAIRPRARHAVAPVPTSCRRRSASAAHPGRRWRSASGGGAAGWPGRPDGGCGRRGGAETPPGSAPSPRRPRHRPASMRPAGRRRLRCSPAATIVSPVDPAPARPCDARRRSAAWPSDRPRRCRRRSKPVARVTAARRRPRRKPAAGLAPGPAAPRSAPDRRRRAPCSAAAPGSGAAPAASATAPTIARDRCRPWANPSRGPARLAVTIRSASVAGRPIVVRHLVRPLASAASCAPADAKLVAACVIGSRRV